MINNIVVIGLTILFSYKASIYVLIFAVIAGQLCHSLILTIPSSKKLNGCLWNRIIGREEKLLLKMALPIMLGNGVMAISMIIDKYLASSMDTLHAKITLPLFLLSLTTIVALPFDATGTSSP